MTVKQDEARRKKNPENKKGYSGTLIHAMGVPCGSTSLYGLTVHDDNSKVTCITCKRMMKGIS